MKFLHHLPIMHALTIGIITALLAPVLSADTITVGKVVGYAKLIDSSGQRPAQAGVTIGENARVTTGNRSRVILLFDNGSAVTVRPNSKFSVQQYDHEPARSNKSITRLKVEKGDAISNVDKLGNGSTFEVNSALGTAGIRGTNLRVNVDAGTISVTDGNAQIQLNNGETVNLSSGSTLRTTVGPDGEVTYQVTEMSEEEQQVMENTSSEANETKDQMDNAQTGSAVESDPAEVASDVTDTSTDDSSENNSESDPKIILVRDGSISVEQVNELDRDTAQSILENGLPGQDEDDGPDGDGGQDGGDGQDGDDGLDGGDDGQDGGDDGQDGGDGQDGDDGQDGGDDGQDGGDDGQGVDDGQDGGDDGLDGDDSQDPEESPFANLIGQLNDSQLSKLDQYPDNTKEDFLSTGDIKFIKSALNVEPRFSNNELTNLINEPLVQAGQVGNVLLSDVTLSGSLPPNNIFTYSEVFQNGYSDALVRLLATESDNENLAKAINTFAPDDVSADTPFADFITSGENADVIGARKFSNVDALSDFGFAPQDGQSVLGKTITLAAGSTYDLKSFIGSGNIGPNEDGEVFAISAFDDVVIDGDITFENNNTDNDNAVVIGAADNLSIADGTGITNQGSNLALGASKSISMSNVSLDTKGTLLVGTLNDLTMNDVTVQTGQNSRRGEVYLYADNTMDVNGLNFGNAPAPSQIYMEAITVDLRNVVFPGSSQVDLVSRDGPIAGKYPNFGSSQTGRVNFIENVFVDEIVDENRINSESKFNSVDHNITIKSFD